jgi:predicted RND superfamily exporter protein
MTLTSLWEAALRRPRTVSAMAALAAAGLAVAASGVRLDPSIALLPEDDPVARAEVDRRAFFGDDLRLQLALYRPAHEGGVLRPDSLAALEDLHVELAHLAGVARVASLVDATAWSPLSDVPAGAPLWTGADEPGADRLRRSLRDSPIQHDALLSDDDEAALVYVGLLDSVDEADASRRVRALARAVEARHPGAGTVLVVGPAVVETGLAEHVLDDLFRLVPLALVVVCGILLAVVRRPVFLVIAFVHCVLLVGAVLAGMALAGWQLNLVSVLAPVVLMPVGLADLLHVFVWLEDDPRLAAHEQERARTIGELFRALEWRMVATSATTAIGFLGFLLSPVAAIRQFGAVMSAGALVALFLTLTVDSALLVLLWRPRGSPRRTPSPGRIERWLDQLTSDPGRLRYRARTHAWAALCIGAAGALSLSLVEIDDTWVQNFAPDSPVSAETRLFEREFMGTNLLAVTVETDPATPRVRSGTVQLVDALTYSLSSFTPGVRRVLSITVLSRALHPPPPPEETPAASTPSFARVQQDYETWERRGPALPRARTFADPDLSRHQMLVFVGNQGYAALAGIVQAIENLASQLSTDHVKVRVGGDLVANVRMVRMAVVGQGQSTLVLMTVLGALAWLTARSLPGAAVLLAPTLLAVLGTYLVLVYASIPYGVAVSMFPTLVAGMAVDFAIHVWGALRGKHAEPTARVRELALAVRGVLLNGAMWVGGFAVLALSRLPPNRNLGLLSSTVILFATTATLFLLPNSCWIHGSRRNGQS